MSNRTIPLRPMCSRHKPSKLGYVEMHNWAKANKEKQIRCKYCDYYFYKCEFGEPKNDQAE